LNRQNINSNIRRYYIIQIAQLIQVVIIGVNIITCRYIIDRNGMIQIRIKHRMKIVNDLIIKEVRRYKE